MRLGVKTYNVILEAQYVVEVEAKSKEEAKEKAVKDWRKWPRPRAYLVLEVIEAS